MLRRSPQSLLPKEAPRKLFSARASTPRPQFVVSQTKDGVVLYRQRGGKLTANLQDAEIFYGLVGKAINMAGDIFEVVPVKTVVVPLEAPENPQVSFEVPTASPAPAAAADNSGSGVSITL